MASDVREWLFTSIQHSKYFTLQLNESTSVTNYALHICFVRFEAKGSVKENSCFVRLPNHATADEVFNKLNEFVAVKTVQVVDFIRSQALNSCFITMLWNGKWTGHNTLLLHTNVRWIALSFPFEL
jgi:hypothetical protein